MIEKKDMNYNFNMILPRLFDSFNYLDDEKVNYILGNIKGNCICTGTGGSNSVSLFSSIVLETTNKIISISKEPRDVVLMDLSNWNYLIGVTYGNHNYGINEAIKYANKNNLKTHLLTTNSDNSEDICYKGSIKNEYSFISLASTIIPMSVMLHYYLKTNKKETLELIKELYMDAIKINCYIDTPLIEIIADNNTYVASKVLESTIVEAGLGISVIHEKYSFCHGRSTLPFTNSSNLIYLINGDYTNLDNKLLLEIKDLYKSIIILNSNKFDRVINEYELVLQSLFLCKEIAEKQNKDLSIVEYSNVVKKLYKYNGGM